VTHAKWIASRSPAPPSRLVERVIEILEDRPALAKSAPPDALVGAAEALLESVLAARAGDARDAALDLLAADACVTWAFEAAADDPGTLGSRAEDAMRRLAAVAR
jgi:hypothetical protein